jgi:hypothetical protein
MKDTMKSKVQAGKSASFAKGGSTKMSGQNYVGTQKPGQSTSQGQKSNDKVAKGGGRGMAGFSGAAPSTEGKVSVGGRGGNTTFAPDRGGKAMAGYTGAQNAKPL